MAIPPVLETQRSLVAAFEDKHLTAKYVSWLNDPEVVRYSEQRHRRHTLETCAAYAASFATGPDLFWAITARESALGHIGNISAHVDERNGVADVGILIGERAAWGKGYGAEVWVAVCRYLLKDLNLRKVTAGTAATNVGMLGIMRHAGMRDDGRRSRQLLIEGAEVDLVHAALYREDVN